MNAYEMIRAKCAERGMTVRELERKAGLANGTLGKWVDSIPHVTTFSAAASALGIPPGQMLEEYLDATEKS